MCGAVSVCLAERASVRTAGKVRICCKTRDSRVAAAGCSFTQLQLQL